ncbi:MAG: YIEGIA protein [Firmicutes bacterium]|nr:YIEGIA protein [Bacillota bacterium]
MNTEFLSEQHIVLIITSVITGTFARLFVLKQDYRQYPSYPNGYLIHIITAFVAAFLGAVAIPALIAKNFVAVTFLALAIQQFREIRKIEKESLQGLENTEYTYRGDAYIDGIAKTFESRNYFSLVVSFLTASTIQLITYDLIWLEVVSGLVVGLIATYLLHRFSKGKTIGDIADVEIGRVDIKGSELYVDNIYVSNLLGSENASKMYKKEGIAAVIYPKEEHFRITLDNFGQRQAALFEATRAVGVKRYHFTRKDYKKGRVVITLIPIIQDKNAFIEAIKKTPLLENVKKSHSIMDTNLMGRK